MAVSAFLVSYNFTPKMEDMAKVSLDGTAQDRGRRLTMISVLKLTQVTQNDEIFLKCQ
jgi:hypothetical protein